MRQDRRTGVRPSQEGVLVGIQYRRRVRLLALGPLQLYANLSMYGWRPGLSLSFKAGPATVNSRGDRSVDLPGRWSWRSR